MAEQNNASCAVCGNGYHVCLHCREKMALTPWKTHTDTPEHYKVFQILRGFSVGIYSKEEARERLENVNLDDREKYVDYVKEKLNEILGDNNLSSELSMERPVAVKRRKSVHKALEMEEAEKLV